MPVSIPASGRARAGSQKKGERFPCTRLTGPGAPPPIDRFQKNPSGRLRKFRSSVSEEVAGSASRRLRGRSIPDAAFQGWRESVTSGEENTRPWKRTGQKKRRLQTAR